MRTNLKNCAQKLLFKTVFENTSKTESNLKKLFLTDLVNISSIVGIHKTETKCQTFIFLKQ